MSNLDTSSPIVVSASPTKPQLAAGIRQAALAIGLIAGAFGMSGVAAKANIVVSVAPAIAELLVVVGPLVAAVAVWLGQMATRRHAQNAAAMAAQLPDQVAKLK